MKKLGLWLSSVLGFAYSLIAGNLPEPVEGTITIDGEYTADTAAEATTLAQATKIVLNEGGVLTYKYNGGDSHSLNLTAQFSGTGTFIATNASKVVLNAANSLTAPGHFEFADTYVDVANYDGLGGANAGRAIIYKVSGHNQLLNFIPVNGCFTNSTAIWMKHQKNSGNYAYFGMSADDGEFVQNADLSLDNAESGECYFSIRGCFTMISGTFFADGHIRFNRCKKTATADWVNDNGSTCPGWVKFIGTTYVSLSSNNPVIYGSNIEFGCAALKAGYGLSPDANRNVTFTKSFVTGTDGLGTSCAFTPYENGNAGDFINLNGTTQYISWIGSCSHGNISSGSIMTPEGKPAFLKVVDPTVRTKIANIRMYGPLSFENAGGEDITFNFKKMESTGDLTVSSGTVAFTNGAGWAGSKVTVKNGGTLKCLSTESLNTGLHKFSMESGAALEIGEGVELYVQTAKFGEVSLEPTTTYTMAQLQELTAGTGVILSGSGTLRTGVKSVPGTWEGWPAVGTATKATIPDNSVATITDDDIAKVEQLTDIDCGSGVTIPITISKDKVLNLKARLDGSMQVSASNAGKVVIWGDNTKLLSPGCFTFVETPVVVSNMFGLGYTQTGTASFTWANGSTMEDLVFGCETQYFTNYVPLVFYKNGNEKRTWLGCLGENDWFFQNADLSFDANNKGVNTLMLTNNFFVIGGKMNVTRCNGTYIFHEPATTEWGFTGNATGNLGSQLLVYRNDLQMSCTNFEATWSLATAGSNHLRFMANGCLSTNTFLRPYANGSGTDQVWMDFCGTTQTVAFVGANAYNGGNHAILYSEAPALLKTTGAYSASQNTSGGLRFAGALSLWHDSIDTLTFAFSKSTSSGELRISKGKVVFDPASTAIWDSGWSGKLVTVQDGGALECNSPDSLTGGHHVLKVEAGGALKIGEGVVLKVGEAHFGSVKLADNTTYTVAEINALISGEGVTLTGTGSITTGGKSIPGTWGGWPEVGTATKVSIPDGTVIALDTAEDIAKVEALDEIDTGRETVINYSGTSLNLKAQLSGSVKFNAVNGGTVTVSGDNSGLVGSGGFMFSNTTAVVTHLYGLGTRESAATELWPVGGNENFCRLWFDGAAVSNEVKLVIHYGIQTGHCDPTVRFVQANDVTQWNSSTSYSRRYCYTNDYTFASGVTANISSTHGLNISDDGCFRVEAGATVVSSGAYGHGDYYLDGDYSGEMRIEQCLGNIIFGKANAMNVTYFLFYDGSSANARLNLNGHSQTLPYVYGHQYYNVNQQTLWVDSATAATVTLDGSATKSASIGFTGFASLTYAGTGVQTIGHATSTTLGTLTVSSGKVILERGYQWLGNVALNGSGTLELTATATNAFGKVNRTRTELAVTTGEGATLMLDSNAATSTVSSVTVDGTEITDKDLLTKDNCSWISGPGVLRIHRPLGFIMLVK